MGELLALTKDKIDLEKQQMQIELVCVEDHRGRFRFRAPLKGRRGASTSAAVRTIALDPEVRLALSHYLEDLSEHPTSKLIEGDVPAGRLFARADGAPHRRTFQSSLLEKMTAQVSEIEDPWPVGATWHYLRHFCATHWIRDLRLDVPTVSKMLGHARVSTTLDWYLDADQEAIDRAKAVLNTSTDAG